MRNLRRCSGVALAGMIALPVPELLGIAGSGLAVAQTTESDWHWSITPYLWGSAINTDVRFPGGQEVSGEAQFSDILDKLDFGAQVHLEGQRARGACF